ncbi:MAG: helix-turn-helix domain-containing protein [Desulfuromusa sp.]|nr:helix-turn-helix domain-containing protein [Desulfuromusa sp.]
MKKIVIGVMSQDKIRKRVLDIARGDYKPKRNEPKIWFPSMKSVAEVLSDQNRALLKMIVEIQPETLTELADAAGRQMSNLSRTLKTMEQYGFVELRRDKRSVKPVVKATEFEIHAA